MNEKVGCMPLTFIFSEKPLKGQILRMPEFQFTLNSMFLFGRKNWSTIGPKAVAVPLYKCVKPAREFLNRLLEILLSGHVNSEISLTPAFHSQKISLPKYNGISLYDHSSVDATLVLDTCLTGMGPRWNNLLYSFHIPRNYRN